MYDLPGNTLYRALNNPLLNKYKFNNITCKELMNEIQKYDNKNLPTPEEEALLFYMSNHGFHLIKSKYKEMDYLSDDIFELVNDHIKLTNQISKRLFYYIILISIEESHFLPKQEQHFYDYMESNFGPDFNKIINKSVNVKNVNLNAGELLRGVRSVFDFGKWNSGYGGKPWGNIVGLSAAVLNGRESFEMMADYAFSLCHNNGSMFNKGHLYKCYTNFIYDILDIQASGQIPNWINENKGNKFINKKILDLHDKYSKLFPEEFKSKLDSKKVKNSGEIRRKKEEQQMKIWKNQTVNYNSGGNTNNVVPEKQNELDKLIIGDYKKNKWI